MNWRHSEFRAILGLLIGVNILLWNVRMEAPTVKIVMKQHFEVSHAEMANDPSDKTLPIGVDDRRTKTDDGPSQGGKKVGFQYFGALGFGTALFAVLFLFITRLLFGLSD